VIVQILSSIIYKLFPLLIFLLLVFSCDRDGDKNFPRKVHIREVNGKYTFYRNGEPFFVKGASGISHFKLLRESGGNTIRIWDTTNLQATLDSAVANDLAVIVGLPVANSDDPSFYSDPKRVKNQHTAFERLVLRHRNNSCILMWCVGNELDFPYKLSYTSFYKAFNDLTDMIHKQDPDHPVTTTVMNFNAKYITNINLRCDVDVISFNIFSRLFLLRQDLKDLSWLWDGPYMLLEWGVNGPWEGTEKTAWGAYIEDTSKKKAQIYERRYKDHMPTDDPRFLGACAFFWGQKQETTHTWFSMFDQYGASSEPVSEMRALWKNEEYQGIYPAVKDILLNDKGARENIILDPNAAARAEVLMFGNDKGIKEIRWEIFREDWYKRNNINSTRKTFPLRTLMKSCKGLEANFIAPAKEGPYRLFATIYHQNGTFATCNTPFYVLGVK